MSNFFNELKNRNVYKVAVAYLVSGWLIMQVVDTMGNNLDWPDAIAAWITKILIVGFPIALVLTWLYEFTPQGFKRTGAIQLDTADNRKAGRRLNHLIIAVLAVAICFILVERVFFAGNVSINTRQEASIAVLPFVNMSPEEDNESFADGLTEEILNKLARISGMQVPARTSSFIFKDKNEDVREIGKLLGVNYILEGSVQFDSRSNRIKITTQLVNTNNGYHLWSETYEDDFEGIFEIQENVSRQVASQLRIQLLPEEDIRLSDKPTENTEAYKLYLESRQYSVKRNEEDLEKAIDLLKRAIALDPDFAEAHAELAFLYPQKRRYGDLSRQEADELRQYHLDRALELAPEKPEVLRANALKLMQTGGDTTKVLADLRRAIQMNPNYADAHYMLYQQLMFAGQSELGRKTLEKTVELDPFNEFFAVTLADGYYSYWDSREEGIKLLERLIVVDSSPRAMRSKAMKISTQPRGDLVQAFILSHSAYKKVPTDFANISLILGMSLNLDLWPVAEKYASLLQMRYPNNPRAFTDISGLYKFRNENQKLHDLLEFWSVEKWLLPREEVINRVDVKVREGNIREARRDFEAFYTYPAREETKADTLHYWTSYLDLFNYTELLRLDNDWEGTDMLAQKVCEFYNSRPDWPSGMMNSLELDCYYLSNDTTRFVRALEDRYFVKKDRSSIFSEIKMGYYQRFYENQQFIRVFDKVTAETHRQRAEVIAYLKEEGDWDPAWDAELGLE